MNYRRIYREFMSELIGTFLLLGIGFSGIFLMEIIYPSIGFLNHQDCGYNNTNCDVGRLRGEAAIALQVNNILILLIAITFGAGLVGAIMVCGHISGSHLNPSVTITLAALGKIPWIKAVYYLPAQYLGAFLSAAAVHLYYLNHIKDDNTYEALDKVFVTSPHSRINIWIATIDGLLSGFYLMLVVLSIGDPNTNGVPVSFHALYIFICFIGVLIAFSTNAGAALNPARDLGPKLYVALFRGFKDVFNDYSYCFWWFPQQVCITLGFLFGGFTYHFIFEQIAPPLQE